MARIVFDLDGTLIDSAPDIRAVANAVLADENLAPLTMAETRDFIGDGTPVFVQRMRAARGLPEADQDRLLSAFMARYDGAVALSRVYPGATEALTALRAAGHSLGLCTNKPLAPTRRVLDHFGLATFFATVWGGDSLAVHKPDPAPLHAAFAALPDGPRLYVGDSDVDAETAERAQVPFLLHTEGYRKGDIATLRHRAAFGHFADLPALVTRCVAEDAPPGP